MKFNIKSYINNFTLLNILLIFLIIALSNYILFSSTSIKISYPHSAKTRQQLALEIPSTVNVPSLSDFLIISEQNLFHPERIIPIAKKEDEKPLPKPEFILYGTLISDNLNIAYLEDLKEPYSTPSRGKRQIPLKKGETLSGFTLREIEPDKVVMVRGEEKIIIDLAESRRKYKSSATPTAQVQSSTPTQPTAQPDKIDKPTTRPASRKQIDQDVFDFFEKRKQQG